MKNIPKRNKKLYILLSKCNLKSIFQIFLIKNLNNNSIQKALIQQNKNTKDIISKNNPA